MRLSHPSTALVRGTFRRLLSSALFSPTAFIPTAKANAAW
jgi:hypothetical protein